MECTKQRKPEFFLIDGKKIRSARIEKEMTLKKLSEISGVTRKTISEIENGKKRKIRFSTIDQIARALGKEIDCLCTQYEK